MNKDNDTALIKAFLGKNDETYHIPDSKEDTFQLILSLVCDLETEEEVDTFIQDFLTSKAANRTIRSELASVLLNFQCSRKFPWLVIPIFISGARLQIL